MRALPQAILAIFAHPDDEIGVGSTLAYYGDAGVITTLVCASRGEAATIYCEDCATPENLADVRTHELECSCRHLGIAELRWLDWPDGGIAALPRPAAVGRLVGMIRLFRPDIVLTHPENGLYPHPDHLAVWEMARAAFTAAADPSQYPGMGAPWAAARLFSRALPQSFYEKAGFGERRVELNGQFLRYYATPDDQISASLHVLPWAPRRMAAWDCHRSQHNPNGAQALMPDGLRRSMAENEHFVLAAGVPLPPGVTDDLMAGLDHWPLFTAAPGLDPDSIDAYQQDLMAGLAARRIYLETYHAYLRDALEEQYQSLLRLLAEREQEFIYLLAGALRRTDLATGNAAPDPGAAAQAAVRQYAGAQAAGARARILHAIARHAVAWYQAQAVAAASAEQRQIWDDLLPLAQENLALVEQYLA